MHLNDHDLRQLDDAYLEGLTREQARALLSKALADLKCCSCLVGGSRRSTHRIREPRAAA